MDDALALAKDAARKRAAEQPEADAYTQAKRNANGPESNMLFDLFADFSGYDVRTQYGRGRIEVTQALNAAHISIVKLVLKRFTPQEAKKRGLKRNPEWRKTGEVVDGWSAWFDGNDYVLTRRGGPLKGFAQSDDLMAKVADEIGRILILEDDDEEVFVVED